jgi:hypothetical protein
MELLGLILCGLVLIALFGTGIFFLLLQLGVIVKKAGEKPIKDMGGYSIKQGRDVGKEE